MSTPAGLRAGNRGRLIAALRRHGRLSRSQLAREIGVSRTTVISLVDELGEQGLVLADIASDGRSPGRGRGRPPGLVRLGPSAGLALGVEIGRRHVRAAIADLSSTVLAEQAVELDVDAPAATTLDAIAGLAGALHAAAGVQGPLVGAGLALPGPVDRHTATVGSAVLLPSWAGLRPAEQLAGRLNVPVVVDNDANLAALAELRLGAGRDVRHMVYLQMSSGIGAGLVLNGRLHRGATGLAGELGHVQVQADGALCRCGSRGCLGTVASGRAILELLRAVHGPQLTLEDALALVADGDLGARRVVRDAGRWVGRVLADLCNNLNPAAIVVGGELSAAGRTLSDGIRESIDARALPVAAEAVTVVSGALGDRAGVLGALSAVIAGADLPAAATAANDAELTKTKTQTV